MSLDLFKGVRRFARSKSAVLPQVADETEGRHAPVVVMTAQDRVRSWSHLGADAGEVAPVRAGAGRDFMPENEPSLSCASGESIANVLARVPKHIRRAPRREPDASSVQFSVAGTHEFPQASSSVRPAAVEVAEAATITLIVSAVADAAVGDAALKFSRQIVRGGRALLLNMERSESYSGPGLSDLLSGRATFTDIIRRDEGSRLHCIELGQGAVAMDDRFDLVVEALAQTYSFLIINGGTADGAVSDALAPMCDMAILNGGQDARPGRLELLRDRLRTAGAPDVLDMILDNESREAA